MATTTISGPASTAYDPTRAVEPSAKELGDAAAMAGSWAVNSSANLPVRRICEVLVYAARNCKTPVKDGPLPNDRPFAV